MIYFILTTDKQKTTKKSRNKKMSHEVAPQISAEEYDSKYQTPEDYYTLEGYGADLLSHRTSQESDLSHEQIRDIMATPLGAIVIEQALREYQEASNLPEEAKLLSSREIFESDTEGNLAETILDDPNQPFFDSEESQEIASFTDEQRQAYKIAYDIVRERMIDYIGDLKKEDPDNWEENAVRAEEISAKMALLFSHNPSKVFGRESGKDSFDEGKTFRDDLYRIFSQAPQPNNSDLRYSYNGRYVSGRAEYAFQAWINGINTELTKTINNKSQEHQAA
jgi:hypothetical protein